MPSIITHELFAQEALKAAPANLKNTIQHYPKEFSIGSSGPDLFFYYNAWPWMDQKKGKVISHLGSQIHSDYIQDFFAEVFIKTKMNPTPAKLSYLCGFLCHWALDKEAHPYIFNQTGDTSTKQGINDHRRFESHLDYLILKELKGVSISKYPSYRLLKFNQETTHAIYDFYLSPLHKVFQYDLSKSDIEKSLQHFEGIQKFLYDPHQVKTKLFYTIEKNILHNPYAFSSMIVPEQADDLDILNLSKRNWHHPCTNQVSNFSFPELFNNALKTASNLLLVLDYYLHNQCTLKQLLQLINNQSFETGLPTKEPMLHFDSIYKNK